MKNVKILDCTLRDGGRLFDCTFLDNEIKQIAQKLAQAKIDIIEIGFLRDKKTVTYHGNSTFFTDIEQMKPFIDKSKACKYVAFIDYGMFDFNTLTPFDGTSIDGLRIGFTKKDYNTNLFDVLETLKAVKDAGYTLFVQTVNSLNYSDDELINLITLVNHIQPASFAIVDTYGAMYIEDVHRMYNLVHTYLHKDITIDFHSHNNYQLSFALAQEIIKLSKYERPIIIDATLHGMGKCAGNLNTELIVDFMIRNLHYDYELDILFDIIDEYIYDYNKNYSWGYSIPALMAGIYKSHPNNVIYLTEKFRLDTKDIKYIMSMIDPETRQKYDYDVIEQIYVAYMSNKVNDYDNVQKLKHLIGKQEVLVLIPGNTLLSCKETIEEYINRKNPFIISVNFSSEREGSIAFFGNQKRYNHYRNDQTAAIITSNIRSNNLHDITVNYESLIVRKGSYFDSSAIMVFNLLRRLEIHEIAIAGFDGYVLGKENYVDTTFEVKRHQSEYDTYNRESMDNFKQFVKTVSQKSTIQFITPSIFEKVLLENK